MTTRLKHTCSLILLWQLSNILTWLEFCFPWWAHPHSMSSASFLCQCQGQLVLKYPGSELGTPRQELQGPQGQACSARSCHNDLVTSWACYVNLTPIVFLLLQAWYIARFSSHFPTLRVPANERYILVFSDTRKCLASKLQPTTTVLQIGDDLEVMILSKHVGKC